MLEELNQSIPVHQAKRMNLNSSRELINKLQEECSTRLSSHNKKSYDTQMRRYDNTSTNQSQFSLNIPKKANPG